MNTPASTDHRTDNSGYFIAIAAAFLFSTKPIIIKWAYGYGIDAVSLLALRMLFAVPVYLIIGIYLLKRMKKAANPSTWAGAAVIGILGYYVASLLDLKGLELANAQLERVILYAYPSFVLILGALLGRNRISSHQIVALLLCYAGIVTLFIQDLSLQGSNVIAGTAYILTSALAFAIYVLFSKQYIDVFGSLLFTAIAMASASFTIGVHALIQVPAGELIEWMSHPQLMSTVIVLSIVATVLPSFMTSEAIKRIGPANAALTGTAGPLMTTVLAIIILGEPFTWIHAIGMALVIMGIHHVSRKKA